MSGERAEAAAEEPADGVAGSAATLGALFGEAQVRGEVGELIGLLAGLSRFRARFEVGAALPSSAAPVRLCTGAAPGLVCLPSVLATAGPHQYARFARPFAGLRAVTALPLPGFLDGEPLPAGIDALLDAHARSVCALAGEHPFVLLGHSTGGVIAYAVAARLQQEGVAPAAVVLIDTYPLDDGDFAQTTREAMGRMLAGATEGALNDVRLTAMAAYGGLLAEWTPVEIAPPTLLVQASEPMSGEDSERAWRTAWEYADEVLESPGDHFTMMEAHAATTAKTVGEWLAGVLEGERV